MIDFVPEERLPVAMLGAFFLPISLFWFGWTSFPGINWIVPIIGSAFFSAGTFLLFQAGLKYVLDDPRLLLLLTGLYLL